MVFVKRVEALEAQLLLVEVEVEIFAAAGLVVAIAVAAAGLEVDTAVVLGRNADTAEGW